MTLLLIVLLVLFLGGFGYGRPRYGWGPPGDIVGVLVLILFIVAILWAVGSI